MKFNKIFVFLLVFCGLLISCDVFDEDDENSVGGGAKLLPMICRFSIL